MTAIICLDGSRPFFCRASFTNASFVRVSRVVPDLETRMNIARDTSVAFSTPAASSGSTLLIKRASILNVPFFFAQFSSAMYIARGPRSLPPMPICTAQVNVSPLSFTIFPLCTSSANLRIFSISPV